MLAKKRCPMTKQRRTFSPELKQQAACLVLDQGYGHMEASRSVGVGETVLRRWVQQLQMERPDAKLVNTMLDAAIEKVADSNVRPVIHSDRGAHYRWPGDSHVSAMRSSYARCRAKDARLTMRPAKASSGD